jgi:enterochelin esterase-like enzyme
MKSQETGRRGDKEKSVFARFLVSLSPLLLVLPISADAQEPRIELRYPYGPDSFRQEGVPQGKVTTHIWKDSKIFSGTIRRYYVYVPAQYDASKPAALMVFQDGHTYIKEDGDFRVPVVFDNLIHKGDMPVTIGVFVDPGHKKPELPPEPGWQPEPENRSFEYDSLSGDYAKFLVTEILPEVRKEYKITDDPEGHAIGGISSGGICAFTVAWQRPDEFRKVLSHVGSFTNIRGGDAYPGMIRKQDKRPLRVFLQDGSNDLDNPHGNWPLGNKQMFAALKFRDYDINFVYGEGGHNGNHGGAILPDSLRWLWRDYPNTN